MAPDTSTPGQAIVSRGDGEFPPWIVDAGALPTPVVLIRREPLEALAQSALKATGLCFVVGPTGTGKSYLAMCVANTFAGPCYWVDLRDTEPSEARKRLKQGIRPPCGNGAGDAHVGGSELRCSAIRSDFSG